MKVMIVEDHADMRRLLMKVIWQKELGLVEFIECERGEDAVIMYLNQKPDCVLMDIELKSMSGFEITEEIYRYDSEAKVIIVTSYDTPTFQRQAKKLKVEGFVSKESLSDVNNILSNIYQG